METKDFCSEISVIPQYIGTCWFNAILMNSFYSQAMRKLMINKVSKTWDNENKVLKFFKTILKRSYNTKDQKIIEMFYKTKPQMLLITYANLFDVTLIKTIKKLKYAGYSSYISMFLKEINVKVLDIVYYHKVNKCLLNSFKYMNKSSVKINKDKEKNEIEQILTDVPDVLVLYNTKLYDYLDYYNLSLKNVNITIHESENYNINYEAIEDIKEYKDEIRLSGHVYKLDSIILENYNQDKGAHAISGITCNNNKYVYNGWCKGTVDPALKQQERKKIIEPYPLVKYNWNLREDKSFCFKPKYSERINNQDLCFSFNKGTRILIYVKDNKEETSSLIRSSSYKSLSGKEEDFKEFHYLEFLNREEIISELNEKKIIYDKTLSTEKLNKILMNTLKKEAEILDDEKKYEYFTLLPIEDYEEEELIKIGDNYYLKKNLFYYLFILELNKTFNSLNNSKIVACYTPDDKLIYIDQIKKLIFYFFETQDLKEIIENYLRVNETIYSNFEEKINKKFKNLDLLYSIKRLIQVFLNIFGIDFFIKLLNLTDTREFMKHITDEKNNFLINYKDLHNEQTNINDLILYLLDRCNKIETIPFEERFIIDNKTYNLVLLFYYYILYNNPSINLKIEDLKLLIFRYYNLTINDYELLDEKIDKEENENFKLNIILNVRKIKSNKKSNFAKRRKTHNEYPCDMFKNDEQQIKGGKKKLLKRY
jgi:hypothetical protein